MQIGDFGQPRLERLLDDMLERERVSGSFLFEGPQGTGKEALAMELGRLLNCENQGRCAPRAEFRRGEAKAAPARCASCRKFDKLQHPDLLVVFPVPRDTWEKEPKVVADVLAGKARDPYYKPDFDRPSSIQAEVLREVVIPAVYSRPVEARLKTIVLSDADQMAPNIGNLLLKTLEEPPEDCLLVLTSAVPERLLPTIRSRCQRLRFSPLPIDWMLPRLQSLHGATPAQARPAAAVAQGSMLAAARFLRGDLQEIRDRAFEVLLGAAGGDALRLLEIAHAAGQEATKRRNYVPLLLHMVAIAGRDALLLAEGAVPAEAPRGKVAAAARGPELVNADRAADLQKVARAMDPADLRGLIPKVEAAARQIAGNAIVEHTLATLFLDAAHAAERPPATARRG